MFQLKSFFDRYRNIEPPEASVRKAVVQALENQNIKIQERSVRVIGSIVYLDIEPVIKNIVFMRKKKILSVITESIGTGLVKDIR